MATSSTGDLLSIELKIIDVHREASKDLVVIITFSILQIVLKLVFTLTSTTWLSPWLNWCWIIKKERDQEEETWAQDGSVLVKAQIDVCKPLCEKTKKNFGNLISKLEPT